MRKLRDYKRYVHLIILGMIALDFYHSGFSMADLNFLVLSVIVELGFQGGDMAEILVLGALVGAMATVLFGSVAILLALIELQVAQAVLFSCGPYSVEIGEKYGSVLCSAVRRDDANCCGKLIPERRQIMVEIIAWLCIILSLTVIHYSSKNDWWAG